MDLDAMKYPQLRSVAKELGLKGNMKADKLLKAIRQHYQQEKSREAGGQAQEEAATAVQGDDNATQDTDQGNEAAPRKDSVSGPAVFVNTRRGKGNRTKRKLSDAATLTNSPPTDDEGDTEVAASSEPCGPRGAKKRKVSSAKESDKSQPPEEQQPDSEDTEKAQKVARAGRIPRSQKLQQKNKLSLKPITPNFKKLHEAHFNKMESIDSYVQRKNKQVETYRSSVKELKKPSDKTKLQQDDDTTQVRANPSRASMFSPVPVNKGAAEEKHRHTLFSASKAPPTKPAGKEAAPFRPSVLSTRRINVRFSEATHDNKHKRSLLKTPARVSSYLTSSTPQKTADKGKPNNVQTSFSATKSPGPFVFTGNTSTSTTPRTQKRSNFDLKASLSRPLTYRPHTGKLKPFSGTKENTAVNNSLISNAHQNNYKQHQVQTRVDRRAKQMEGRKQKKESILGARRGLVVM